MMNAQLVAMASLIAFLGAGSVALAESSHGAEVASFSVPGGYAEADARGSSCRSHGFGQIVGHEPARAGRYPLFVYMTGTLMKFNGLEAQTITREMAKRGFVAATVQYDNKVYPYCSGIMSKAKCVFDTSSPESALSKLCTRSNVDCDQGVVCLRLQSGLALGCPRKEPRLAGARRLPDGSR